MLNVVRTGAASLLDTNQKTLTEYELSALSGLHNLADGHAYHTLSEVMPGMELDLDDLWRRCERETVPIIERRYISALGVLSKSATLENKSEFKVTPTASNSIDIVGAFLAGRKLKTLLIEPTFDNLFLILSRRGVIVEPLAEARFLDEFLGGGKIGTIGHLDAQALFLVDPNNPTGLELSRSAFSSIVEYCASQKIILIVDKSFRYFGRTGFDDYEILESASLDYIVIEDTGKVWPTHDLKASALVYSASLSSELESIFNEIYLCHSRFALSILEKCILETDRLGLEEVVWKPVRRRREFLRQTIANAPVCVDRSSLTSNLSVEWLNCEKTGQSDADLTAALNKHGVMVLPGRHFHWSEPHQPSKQSNIRVAMMKPWALFEKSVLRMTEVLIQLERR